jgi:hypothetical protein
LGLSRQPAYTKRGGDALNDERLYNYRLYHLVYHWAAFVAISVLLLSLGALVCVSPEIRFTAYLCFANILGGAASLFALYRQRTFVDQLYQMMGGRDPETQTQRFLRHPYNLVAGAVLTFAIVVINLIMIANLP